MARCPAHGNRIQQTPSGAVNQIGATPQPDCRGTAAELKLIKHDTKKFSHTLRDFRNYIHPFEQMSVGFSTREGTAKISLQVLKSALYDISQGIAMLGV